MSRSPTGGDLQPRCAILRQNFLAAASPDWHRDRARCSQYAGGCADRLSRSSLLSSVLFRNVRAGPGTASIGENTVLPAISLCGGEALRSLDDGELSREL